MRAVCSAKPVELIGYGPAEKKKRSWSSNSGVYTYGSNECGQLGFAMAEDEDDDSNIEEQPYPSQVSMSHPAS